MTLDEFAAVLSAHPDTALQLVLPDGSFVPAHFHVTEVGRVQKDFVDCGGTVRRSTSCVLQVWVANDVAHRLDTTKLAKIIHKGVELFETTAIPLEVEYDHGVISQYPVQEAEASQSGIILHLGTKHTTCLAQDRCGIKLDVLSSCSTSDCC
ncbi:MAG: DUF6428 family protein [Planctomycetia bacterium]|nr:DUF6428 family protein [Planctomycetia bacterium]